MRLASLTLVKYINTLERLAWGLSHAQASVDFGAAHVAGVTSARFAVERWA